LLTLSESLSAKTRLSGVSVYDLKYFLSGKSQNHLDNLYPARYTWSMKYRLRSTKQYDKWFSKLKESTVKIRVLARLNRVENGNFGDFKQISPNLFELRFFFGASLRIYYTIQDSKVVFLLAGGDKSSQEKDIAKVAELLKELED